MAFPGAPFASTREHPRDPFLIRQMRLPLKRRMWQGARATKCGRGRYDDDQEYAVLGAFKILARTWANHALAKTNRADWLTWNWLQYSKFAGSVLSCTLFSDSLKLLIFVAK